MLTLRAAARRATPPAMRQPRTTPTRRSRSSAGARPRTTPPTRRCSSKASAPSPLRVAARVARIAGELGLLQLRKARNVDVRIRSVKMKRAFVRLGPAFVKIGQALATRRDVLPPELCAELATLQDAMPPALTGPEAVRVIESDLGRPVHELFEGLDAASLPVASASLGQVYQARLWSGEEVAVKVQRDNILETLEVDAVAVRSFVAVVSHLWRAETDFAALADEIVGRIGEELDYIREARDAKTFATLYANADVTVPRVFDDFCGAKVLTLSYLPGTKLDEIGALPTEKKKKIIAAGIKCTARQFFEVGFFHADPHPGNLLVDAEGNLAYLDFGKMDRLGDDDRFALMSVVVHFANRDAGGLARDFRGLGFVDDHDAAERALTRALEAALREPRTMFGGRAMAFSGVIAFLRAALPAESTIRFALPPRFASVVRALGALEGAVLAVDPEFEVVTAAYPHVARALLADRDPRARQALRGLVLDRHGRIRWKRLEALGTSAFKDGDEASLTGVVAALGGKDAVVNTLVDACDYVCSDAGARTRAALVDDAEAWCTTSAEPSALWRILSDAPELVAPVAARAAASHEARRSFGLLAGRLRARHGWRAPASLFEAASRALGEALDDGD